MSSREQGRGERWADYLAGRLSVAERSELEQEILESDDLSADLYDDLLLAEPLAATDQSVSAGSRPARSPAPRMRRLWAVVLPIAAVLAFVVLWPRDGSIPDGSEQFRGENGQHGMTPRGPVDAAPREFQWSAVAGAEWYRFELTGADGRRVFETTVTTNRVEVPSGQEISSGIWKVIPISATRHELPSLPVQAFEVSP